MPRLTALLKSPAFFRIWVGYGAIVVIVAVFWLSFRAGWRWGLATLLLHLAAWLEASTGLCSRCTHLHCGLHGKLQRRIFGYREYGQAPLSPFRKRIHLGVDITLCLWWLAWLWTYPLTFWLGTFWLLLTAYAVLPHTPAARENAIKYIPS